MSVCGHLARLPDQVARSQVPVDVGILERESTQKKRQDQEKDDEQTVRASGRPGRFLNMRIRCCQPLRRRSLGFSSTLAGLLSTSIRSDLECGKGTPICRHPDLPANSAQAPSLHYRITSAVSPAISAQRRSLTLRSCGDCQRPRTTAPAMPAKSGRCSTVQASRQRRSASD